MAAPSSFSTLWRAVYVAALCCLVGVGSVAVTSAQPIEPGTWLSTFTGGITKPVGVALDAAGNLYVVDEAYYAQVTVRDPAGKYTSIAAGLRAPSAVAVNQVTGTMYVTDAGNGNVVVIASNGTELAVFTTGFSTPTGLALTALGNLIVADCPPSGTPQLVVLSSSGAVLSTGIGLGAGFSTPLSVAVDAQGNYIVADYTNVYFLSAVDGSTTNTLTFFISPSNVAVDSHGFVYVTDSTNRGQLWKLNPDGTVNEQWGGFYNPTAVVVDPSGTIYVADALIGSVIVLTSSGTVVNNFTPTLFQPTGLAIDSAGDMYVVDCVHPHVDILKADGTQLRYSGGAGESSYELSNFVDSTHLIKPCDIKVDANHNMYIVDAQNHTPPSYAVFVLSPTDSLLFEIYYVYKPSTELNFVSTSLAIDSSNNIYIADQLSMSVREFPLGAPGSQPVEIQKWGYDSYNEVDTVAVDSNGNVYIGSEGQNVIQMFSADDVYQPQQTFHSATDPAALAVDLLGNVYVADYYGTVYVLSPDDEVLGEYGGFRRLTSIAVDSYGNIYVCDQGAGQVVALAGLGPVVTDIEPSTYGTQGGVTVTLTGASFGTNTPLSEVSVTIGGVSCPVTAVSQTSIQCTLPAGVGASLAVSVTVAGQTSSSVSGVVFSYQPPTISTVAPSLAAADGGTAVTLTGSNFGSGAASTYSLTIGGQVVVPSSYSQSQVVVVVPAGVGINIPIVLTVAAQSSQTVYVSYTAPTVASVAPSVAASGALLTVSGDSFGSSTGGVSVLVGSSPCSVNSVAPQMIVCTVPLGQGTGLAVSVTVAGQQGQLSSAFGYSAPTLTAPTNTVFASDGGTSVTLAGSNFGTGASDTYSLTVAGQVVPTTSYTPTQLSFVMPAGVGTHIAIVLTVAGQASNTLYVSYTAPTETQISPSTGPTAGGTTLAVTGDGFGSSSGQVTVTIGGVSCPVTAVSQTSIQCTLPAGVGASLAVSVTVAGQTSSSVSGVVFSYQPPTISTVAPSLAAADGGTAVTLTGSNFGSGAASTYSLTIGGQVVVPSSYSQSQVVVVVPAGVGINIPIVLTVAAQSSQTVYVSYTAPTVASVAPSVAASGALLTVSGDSFGSSTGGVSVLVGSSPCSVNSVAPQMIVCTVPLGQGTGLAVSVTVAGQQGQLSSAFGYSAPTLTAPTNTVFASDGGTSVTLAGSNFGTGASDTYSLTVAGQVVPTTSYTPTQLSFVMPAGVGTHIAIVLTVAGQASNTLYVSYTAPTETQISPSTGPTAGGTTLAVTGDGFGSSSGQVTVTIGGVSCPVTAVSQTSIQCTLPAGVGASLAVSVTVAGQTSSSVSGVVFSYQPPTISTVAPSLAAADGGTAVTLTGSNFGSGAASTYSLTIGGQVVVPSSYSQSQVVVVVPAGVGINIPIVLTVAAQSSQTVYVSYTAPTVASVAPSVAASGALLTVSGDSFGSSTGGVSVLVGSSPCSVNSVAPQMIVCTVPLGQGTGLAVSVTVAGQQGQLSSAFGYSAPTLTAPTNTVFASDGGTSVTLAGSNFGTGASDTYSLTVAGQVVPTTSYTPTQLSFVMPAGVGTHIAIVLTVAGQDSNTLYVSYTAPTETQISPSTGPTAGGTTLAVTGDGFGSSSGQVTVTIGGVSCPVTAVSQTSIQCTLPAGVGASLAVSVTVAGQTSSSVSGVVFSYQPPTISTVAPSLAAADGGTAVTLTGSNFGSGAASTYSLTIGGQVVVPSSYSQSQVVVVVPAGVGINIPIVLTVAAQSSQTVYVSYTAPTVASVAPSVAASGALLTVSGDSFGSSTGGVSVLVGSSPCSVNSVAPQMIVCTVPLGQGTGLAVSVTVAGQQGQLSSAFGYSAPTLTAPTNTVFASDGGTSVTLAGSNFGTGASDTYSLTVAGQVVPTTSYTPTQLSFVMPAGVGTHIAIVLTVAGQASNTLYVSYTAPTETQISPSTGPTAGGTTLAVTGDGFGSSSGQVTVTIGGVSCPVTAVSQTSIQCTLPAGVGASLAVSVTVAGQTSSSVSGVVFSYQPPTISTVAPSLAAADGGTAVTLTGSNFGSGAASTYSLTIGGQVVVPSSYSQSQVVVVVPAGVGINIPIVLTVAAQSSQTVYVSYTAPTVASVAPSVAASGALLTVSGDSFGSSTGGVSVLVGSSPCSVNSVAPQMIVCTVPLGQGTGLIITVTVKGQSGKKAAAFSYPAPTITRVVPSLITPTGGVVTLTGTNFGDGSTYSVYVDAVAVPSTTYVNATTVAFTTTAHNGTLPVRVTVGGQTSNNVSLTYESYTTAVAGPGIPVGCDAAPANGSVVLNFQLVFNTTVPTASAVANSVHSLFGVTANSIVVCFVTVAAGTTGGSGHRRLLQVTGKSTTKYNVSLTLVLPPALSATSQLSVLSQSFSTVPTTLAATLVGTPTVQVILLPGPLYFIANYSLTSSYFRINLTSCIVTSGIATSAVDGSGKSRTGYAIQSGHGQLNFSASYGQYYYFYSESWIIDSAPNVVLFNAPTWLPASGLNITLSPPISYPGGQITNVTISDPVQSSVSNFLNFAPTKSC